MVAHLFWLQYFDRILDYLGPLVGIAILHRLIFSGYICGILDPLFMMEVAFTFTITTAWFVYHVGEMAEETFYLLMYCQAAAYLGFILLAPTRRQVEKTILKSSAVETPTCSPFAMFLFRLGSVSFVISTLTDYLLAGIPLFRESRQGAFVGSGGLGIILRFEDVSSMFIPLLVSAGLFYRGKVRQFELVGWILVAVVFSVLSGAKASLLSFVQIVYIGYLLKGGAKIKLITKESLGTAVLATTAALAVILVGTPVLADDILDQFQGNKLTLAFYLLFYRLVNSGDTFIYAYPNNAIGSVSDQDGWVALFLGFLTTFRLVDPATAPVHLGLTLYQMSVPGSEVVGGPNAYFSVFGSHYFGYIGGLFFSLIVGLLVGVSRRLILLEGRAMFTSESPRKACYSLLAFTLGWLLIGSMTDPPYTVSRLVSFMLFFGLLGPIAAAVYSAVNQRKV